MSEPPRRLRPTPGRRVQNNLEGASPNLASGRSRTLQAIPGDGRRDSDQKGLSVVIHGDDPDVPRPPAVVAYWIGAATPANAEVYDLWFTETI